MSLSKNPQTHQKYVTLLAFAKSFPQNRKQNRNLLNTYTTNTTIPFPYQQRNSRGVEMERLIKNSDCHRANSLEAAGFSTNLSQKKSL